MSRDSDDGRNEHCDGGNGHRKRHNNGERGSQSRTSAAENTKRQLLPLYACLYDHRAELATKTDYLPYSNRSQPVRACINPIQGKEEGSVSPFLVQQHHLRQLRFAYLRHSGLR